MSVFDHYAEYYDAMYPEKDYEAEVSYVETLIREHHHQETVSILDLGCGTGKHAVEFASRGHLVRGVDSSPEMVTLAEARKSALPDDVKKNVSFSVGDVQSVRLDTKYDVVLALFHVASYQTTNDAFCAFLETARYHLRPNGILVFDFWYGPAVLSLRPEVRVKRAETANRWIVRIAEPVAELADNCVVVKYEIIDCSKKTGVATRINEEHRMRFLFLPELRLFAEKVGIDILCIAEWMKDSGPADDSWSLCVVARPRPKESLL
jgi:SAM-dependent methyltransferase